VSRKSKTLSQTKEKVSTEETLDTRWKRGEAKVLPTDGIDRQIGKIASELTPDERNILYHILYF
jgi:hypothetical protein